MRTQAEMITDKLMSDKYGGWEEKLGRELTFQIVERVLFEAGRIRRGQEINEQPEVQLVRP